MEILEAINNIKNFGPDSMLQPQTLQILRLNQSQSIASLVQIVDDWQSEEDGLGVIPAILLLAEFEEESAADSLVDFWQRADPQLSLDLLGLFVLEEMSSVMMAVFKENPQDILDYLRDDTLPNTVRRGLLDVYAQFWVDDLVGSPEFLDYFEENLTAETLKNDPLWFHSLCITAAFCRLGCFEQLIDDHYDDHLAKTMLLPSRKILLNAMRWDSQMAFVSPVISPELLCTVTGESISMDMNDEELQEAIKAFVESRMPREGEDTPETEPNQLLDLFESMDDFFEAMDLSVLDELENSSESPEDLLRSFYQDMEFPSDEMVPVQEDRVVSSIPSIEDIFTLYADYEEDKKKEH